jgi:hypothetical protein
VVHGAWCAYDMPLWAPSSWLGTDLTCDVLGHSSRHWLGYGSWVQNPLLRTVCEGVKVREVTWSNLLLRIKKFVCGFVAWRVM